MIYPDHMTEDKVKSMELERTVTISCNNNSIEIILDFDGERESSTIEIDGVLYHFERIHSSQLMDEYKIDNDPDYQPHTDKDGYCYIIAPYSR